VGYRVVCGATSDIRTEKKAFKVNRARFVDFAEPLFFMALVAADPTKTVNDDRRQDRLSHLQ